MPQYSHPLSEQHFVCLSESTIKPRSQLRPKTISLILSVVWLNANSFNICSIHLQRKYLKTLISFKTLKKQTFFFGFGRKYFKLSEFSWFLRRNVPSKLTLILSALFAMPIIHFTTSAV